MAVAAGTMETVVKTIPAKAAAKKTAKKPFTLEPPFTDPKWPVLSAEQCEIIMELLCRLLEPIGTHRAAWIKPSKGKRDRKRKRNEQNLATSAAEQSVQPSPPAISQHVAIGFNEVVRCLDPASERLMNQAMPSAGEKRSEEARLLTLALIFVDQSTAPEILWSQVPFLVATAEMRDASHRPRVVPLSRGSAARLSEVLGVPRVGIVAVGNNAPESASLVSFVNELIPFVDIPWLKTTNSQIFLPTSVVPHAGPSFRNIAKT